MSRGRMDERPDRKQESLLGEAVRRPGTVALGNSLEEEVGVQDPALVLCPWAQAPLGRARVWPLCALSAPRWGWEWGSSVKCGVREVRK